MKEVGCNEDLFQSNRLLFPFHRLKNHREQHP